MDFNLDEKYFTANSTLDHFDTENDDQSFTDNFYDSDFETKNSVFRKNTHFDMISRET